MSNPEVSNLHILNYFNARIPDVANLDQLLRIQKHDDGKISSKRKLALISSKKRTSSYMRYKSPRLQKQRKLKINRSSTGKETQLYCRHHRRNRYLLSRLHSISEIEAINSPVNCDKKVIPKWLETHFWHKKRFFTKLCWGYCLPIHHKARGKRFLHSAIQDATVIHDSSYIRPLQIIGLHENVQQLLRHFTDPSTDFLENSLDQKKNTSPNGSDFGLLCEVPILLYRRDKFPMECLGPASLCVIPSEIDENSISTHNVEIEKVQIKIWIWCHPAIFQEAFDEFTAMNENDLDLEINCVPGGLLRFNVRGRGSLSTLNKVLKTVTSPLGDGRIDSKTLETKVTGNFGGLDVNSNRNFENEDFFARVATSQQISRIWHENAVLGIEVTDVRQLTAFYNDKENIDGITSTNIHNIDIDSSSSSSIQDTDNNTSKKHQLLWPKGSSSSPLWNDKERRESSKNFIRDHNLNKDLFDLRQNSNQILSKNDDSESFLINPQYKSEVQEQETEIMKKIPILIIRKDLKNFSSERLSKSKKKSAFLGFDIILPSDWGAAVWKAFQFANARAIGLDELESIQVDHGMVSFPRDYPDTTAGRRYWSEKEINIQTIDSRRPPKKRFGNLGLPIPRWKKILWSDNESYIDTNEICTDENIVCDIEDSSDLSKGKNDLNSIGIEDNSGDVYKTGLINLNFIVAREEKYVKSFRIPSLLQNHEANGKDINFAYQYAITHNGYSNKNGGKSNNDKNDIITKQIKENHELFISLMDLFVQESVPLLSFQTMLSVLLVPCGRGIAVDGTEILEPNEDDYKNFIYYHEKRSELSMSSTRQSNKRMGEWRGINMNVPTDQSLSKQHSNKSKKPKKSLSEKTGDEGMIIEDSSLTPMEAEENLVDEKRRIIGFVTSGRYKGSPSGAISMGLCDATSLITMQKYAAQIILNYENNHEIHCTGKILNLVMFRSPRSKWLRPALVDIISVLN